VKSYNPLIPASPAGRRDSDMYDIVKAKGGDIKVDTKEAEISEFIIEWASKRKL
jgi:hypothetical protein